MTSRFAALAVLCGIATATVPAADPADPKKPVTREFKVSAVAELKMEVEGGSATVVATSVYRYTWKREGKERTLVLRELGVKAKAGGQERMDVTMSRAGLASTGNGKTVDRKYDDLPTEAQQMLRDTFDAPICKLEVDAAGKEVKRTVVAGPGAKVALDTGMIANTTLFHPPFAADKDEWQVAAAVSAGQGEAAGKLTYTKLKDGKTAKVSGTLKADGVPAGGTTIKDGKYVVTGTHAYDPKVQEWVSGKLDIDLSFVAMQGDKPITAKGKMALTFEMLPEKK